MELTSPLTNLIVLPLVFAARMLQMTHQCLGNQLSCARTASVLSVETPPRLVGWVWERDLEVTKGILHAIWCWGQKEETRRDREREGFLIKVIAFRRKCYMYWSPASQDGHHQLNGNREYTLLFCFVSMHILCFFSLNCPHWDPCIFHLIFSLMFCLGGEVRNCFGEHLVAFQGQPSTVLSWHSVWGSFEFWSIIVINWQACVRVTEFNCCTAQLFILLRLETH